MNKQKRIKVTAEYVNDLSNDIVKLKNELTNALNHNHALSEKLLARDLNDYKPQLLNMSEGSKYWLWMSMYQELAVNMFEWDTGDQLDSAYIENNIFNLSGQNPILFKWETDINGIKTHRWIIRPSVGVVGTLGGDNEYLQLQPYVYSGLAGETTEQRAARGRQFYPVVTLNHDCVLLNEYISPNNNNGNNSAVLKLFIRDRVIHLLDIDNARAIQRKWLKIPFTFDSPDANLTKDLKKQLEYIMDSMDNNTRAVVTHGMDKLNVNALFSKSGYSGAELWQEAQQYEADIYKVLGISHKATNKESGVSVEETNKNDNVAEYYYNARLRARERIADHASRYLGLKMSVKPVVEQFTEPMLNSGLTAPEGFKNDI